MLWEVNLLWGGVSCSGELLLGGNIALGNCSWEAILLWGIALGRQYCSGELLLGGNIALGRCQLLWGGNLLWKRIMNKNKTRYIFEKKIYRVE